MKLTLLVLFISIFIFSIAKADRPVHFDPCYIGNGYNLMTFFITSATIDGIDMEEGDEIGIFDDTLCVGAGVLEDTISVVFQVNASADDPDTPEKDGFTDDNTATFKLWDSDQQLEVVNVTTTYSMGEGNFEQLGTSMVSLNGNITFLHADFSAYPLTGYSPLVVDFNDHSTGTITSWEWDFNDDDEIDSYEQEPSFKYTVPGLYTVTLTVSDGKGSDTETKEDYIEVIPSGNHFIPCYQGNGYNLMTIFITSATIDGIDMEAGDEIGIFDDTLCVGAGVLEDTISVVFQVNASADDQDTPEKDGFIDGNKITYKLWDASKHVEINNVTTTYTLGNGTFQQLGTAMLTLIGYYYGPDWFVDSTHYNYKGTIICQVYNSDSTLFSSAHNDLIGAFCNTVCRGVQSSYEYPTNSGSYIFPLNVFSNETSGDILEFKYWDASTSLVHNIYQTIEFFPDMSYGIQSEPYNMYISISVDETSELSCYKFYHYPNPMMYTDNTINVRFSLIKNCTVSIDLYNIRGQHIETLINEEKNIGEYMVTKNIGDLSSGIYFITMNINGVNEEIRKVVVMR